MVDGTNQFIYVNITLFLQLIIKFEKMIDNNQSAEALPYLEL